MRGVMTDNVWNLTLGLAIQTIWVFVRLVTRACVLVATTSQVVIVVMMTHVAHVRLANVQVGASVRSVGTVSTRNADHVSTANAMNVLIVSVHPVSQAESVAIVSTTNVMDA